EVLAEEEHGPRAEGNPLVPAVLRIAVAAPLVDEDRHDGKPLVRLQQHVLGDQEALPAVEKERGVVDARAEVGGRALPVLDAESVVAAVPLEALVLDPEGIAAVGRNRRPAGGRTALPGGEIEPRG